VFDYGLGRARELGNDKILQTMFDQVLDGQSDKQIVYEDTQRAHPNMKKEIFNDLWVHLEEEATQKDNF
jgi:hypothetical protein